MNKLLSPVILCTNNKNYFEVLISNLGYTVLSTYRGHHFILRNFRKLWFKYRFPFPQIWYKKDILKESSDTYILFDSLVTKDYLSWLKQKLNGKRIIFWYWNPTRNSVSPNLLKHSIYEKWSYSPVDCKDYSLKYNTQFYFKNLVIPEAEIIYDVFFLGRDKGRISELLELKQKFESLKLNVKFHISPNQRQYLKNDGIYQKLIPYDMALIEMARSRAILDILSDPMDGLSLRALESLFHERKLITNSQTIINYDFYNTQNIFILGKDDFKDLPSFIKSPYRKIDYRIVDSYDFKNWIKRFL